MENNKNEEQIIVLTNRKSLKIGATKKIISLKPELIQLDTSLGGLIVAGSNLELVNLDNSSNQVDIIGNIDSLKFTEIKNKESIFRKIFK